MSRRGPSHKPRARSLPAALLEKVDLPAAALAAGLSAVALAEAEPAGGRIARDRAAEWHGARKTSQPDRRRRRRRRLRRPRPPVDVLRPRRARRRRLAAGPHARARGRHRALWLRDGARAGAVRAP